MRQFWELINLLIFAWLWARCSDSQPLIGLTNEVVNYLGAIRMTGSVSPSISGTDDIMSIMFSVAHCSLVIIITCLSPGAGCMNLA